MNRFSLKTPPGGTKPFGAGATSPEGYLLGLWVHECRRVFADKLISHEDKNWVDRAITDLCRQEFPVELCKQVWCFQGGVGCLLGLTAVVCVAAVHVCCCHPVQVGQHADVVP